MTHPLGSLHLFGLDDRRLDAALTLGLLILVAASRLAAFPVSIWEQDEAIFAGAVLHFDPTDNLPHPPWFPLWITAGKLVHLFGINATTSLQLVSLFFSVWILFPLTALWSTVLSRTLAVGAAVLFLIAPGPWFLSGRAFSGTAATALLVAALAFWLGAEDRSRWLAAGSLLAALAVLVRPHFLPAVIGVLLIVSVRASKNRLQMLTAFFAPILAGAFIFLCVSGGPDLLWSALETHGGYHFSRLDQVQHGFAESGFARALGHPAVAAIWLGLSLLGLAHALRKGRWPACSPILIGATLPLLVVIHGFSNSAHARYVIPLLALSTGFVISGLDVGFRRITGHAVGVIAIIATAFIVPQLSAYRSTIAPPVAALDTAIAMAESHGTVLVIDSSVHAFWRWRSLQSPIGPDVLLRPIPPEGVAASEFPPGSIILVDQTNRSAVPGTEVLHRFTATTPLIRSLSQDRFLDVEVMKSDDQSPAS